MTTGSRAARTERSAPTLPTPPKRGERWVNSKTGQVSRVMCDPVEGYVMARYVGAAPWLMPLREWFLRFAPSEHTPSAAQRKRVGCAYCQHPLFAGLRCDHCGRSRPRNRPASRAAR